MKSLEKYLRAIYQLSDSGDAGTTTSELAKFLGVSDASASEAIQKLEDQNLVCRAPYKGFTLSPMGRERGKNADDKYDTLKEFFEKLGVEDAGNEAASVEQHISDDAVERIRSDIL